MNRTDCPSVEALSAFALGKLAEAELEDVANHLDACTECEELAGRLDGSVDPMVSELRRLQEAGLGSEPADPQAAGAEEPPAPASTIESWGEFRIVRELGRGGMGVVFEAYQGSLNRHVALKFLPINGDLARFRREARAAGRLHHTNIVPVFGVGEHQGRHFYVMQYIVGRGLDALLARRAGTGGERARFDDRQAARIGVQVAEALAYAHAQGVIHRDIKPSNLLIDDHETVWVTDFGLAHDASDTVTLTHTGDFLGTLRYVAPERLSGPGDERADLYGLGVTLYELVCGRAAYDEADRSVLVQKVLYHDPPRPRQRVPAIARDFETIVLRAMAREPGHRYATAEAMAEDLRRFLDDRSILARRAGPLERAVRWSRRNKLVAGLLAALVLVFLAGFAGVTVQWRRANAEAIRANLKAEAEAEARAAEAEARAGEKTLRIRAQFEIATRDFDKGLDLARKGDVDHGLLWMAQALVQTPAEQPDFARMVRANLSGWENQVLRRRAVLDLRRLGAEFAQFSPDGRAIVTLCDDQPDARLWDVATGRLRCPPLRHDAWVRCAEFSPDGRLVATGSQDRIIRIWDAATGKSAGPALVSSRSTGPQSPAILFAFSPDGRLLLSHHATRQESALWDVKSGQRLELPKQAGTAIPAWFLPGGSRVVLVNGASQMTGIWDTATGSIAPPTIRGDRLGLGGLFAGGRIIGISRDGQTARLWEVNTGRAVATLPPASTEPLWAALSPDGRHLFACYRDTTALIWDVVNNRPARGIRPDTGFGPGGEFSPDGRLLVTRGPRATARLHDVATGRQVGSSLRHERPVQRASFSPDGRLILTICNEGDAVLWEVGPSVPTRRQDVPEPGIQDRWRALVHSPGTGHVLPAFSRDGSRVLRNGPRIARLVEVSTGQPIGRPTLNRWPLGGPIAFSPDGRRVATSSHDLGFGKGGSRSAVCQIFDAATGRPVSPLLPHSDWVSAMAFSPDGTMLATGDYGAMVHLWNAETGAMVGKPFSAGSIVWSVAVSPDGRLLAAGTVEPAHQVMLWDLATGRRRGDPARLRLRVDHLAFSPDGALLLAAARIGPVPLIDTANGRVRSVLRPDSRLFGIAFSPDGRLILTSGDNAGEGNARLWDAGSGEPVSPVVRHAVPAAGPVAFNPAGTAWAMAYLDGSVWLCDVATARPIGAAGPMREGVTGIAFGPDGRSLLATDRRGTVTAWPVPQPASGTTEALIRRVQLRTGMKIDSVGAVAFLSPSDWGQLRAEAGDPMWNAFALSQESERGEVPDRIEPHALATSATDDQAWHEANARDAEVLGDSFGARWHLDRLIALRPEDGLLYARRARVGLRAGDVDAAGADIERAIRLGPRDRILDWLDHRAIDSLSDERPADALQLLEPIVAARPDDWLTYAIRADAFAALRRMAEREADVERAIERGAEIPYLIRIADERSRAGRWREAVVVYDRAIAMGTVPYEVWLHAATAHLEIGDEEGFRRVCRTLRDRHSAAISEPLVGSILAGALVLGPGGVGEDGKVLGWVEPLPSAADPSQKPLKREFLRVLGAVLYRAGRYREAIVRVYEAISMGGGDVQPEEALFLALARFQAGEPGNARALLAAPWSDQPDGPSAEDWWEARGHRLLRVEAMRLMLDPSFPVDPFTP